MRVSARTEVFGQELKYGPLLALPPARTAVSPAAGQGQRVPEGRGRLRAGRCLSGFQFQFQGKHVESGTVQFHVSTDSEEHLVTAAEILRKDRDESEKPPTPSLSECFPDR